MHVRTFVLFPAEQWRSHAATSMSDALRERLIGFRYELEPGHERPCPCECLGRSTFQAARVGWKTRLLKSIARFAMRSAEGVVDPHCPKCGGTGVNLSTFNPQGRLDYWIELDGSDSDWLFPGDGHEQLPGKTATAVSDIVRMLDEGQPETPAAIITPDDQWFDETRASRTTWPEQAYVLLSRYTDCVAVVVDCHI